MDADDLGQCHFRTSRRPASDLRKRTRCRERHFEAPRRRACRRWHVGPDRWRRIILRDTVWPFELKGFHPLTFDQYLASFKYAEFTSRLSPECPSVRPARVWPGVGAPVAQQDLFTAPHGLSAQFFPCRSNHARSFFRTASRMLRTSSGTRSVAARMVRAPWMAASRQSAALYRSNRRHLRGVFRDRTTLRPRADDGNPAWGLGSDLSRCGGSRTERRSLEGRRRRPRLGRSWYWTNRALPN